MHRSFSAKVRKKYNHLLSDPLPRDVWKQAGQVELSKGPHRLLTTNTKQKQNKTLYTHYEPLLVIYAFKKVSKHWYICSLKIPLKHSEIRNTFLDNPGSKGIKKEITNYIKSNEKVNTWKLMGPNNAVCGGNLTKQLRVFITKDHEKLNQIHIFKKIFKPHKINQNHKEI